MKPKIYLDTFADFGNALIAAQAQYPVERRMVFYLLTPSNHAQAFSTLANFRSASNILGLYICFDTVDHTIIFEQKVEIIGYSKMNYSSKDLQRAEADPEYEANGTKPAHWLAERERRLAWISEQIQKVGRALEGLHERQIISLVKPQAIVEAE